MIKMVYANYRSSIASGKIVFVSISIEDPDDKENNELDRMSRAIASAKLQVNQFYIPWS